MYSDSNGKQPKSGWTDAITEATTDGGTSPKSSPNEDSSDDKRDERDEHATKRQKLDEEITKPFATTVQRYVPRQS